MAAKRSFSVKNKSQCVCLKCGAQILPDDLKDNTVYKCVRCGQEMTVDRLSAPMIKCKKTPKKKCKFMAERKKKR